MKAEIKSALIESKRILEFIIENEDFDDMEYTNSIKHYLHALNAGCMCDDYNGFDCGCGKRSALMESAFKALTPNPK